MKSLVKDFIHNETEGFEGVNFLKSHSSILAETYLGPYETSMMDLFCENI